MDSTSVISAMEVNFNKGQQKKQIVSNWIRSIKIERTISKKHFLSPKLAKILISVSVLTQFLVLILGYSNKTVMF